MSAKFFVEVIGSVDQTMVGPFPTREAAEAMAKTVPANFDAHAMTEAEMLKSFDEFGPIPLNSPADFAEGILETE